MGRKPSDNITIIDEGLTVEGDISGDGELIIKGTVRGALSGERVTIAAGGAVIADVQAARMTIAGRCQGKVKVDGEVAVLASGSCRGEIHCMDLVVEEGAHLNARVRCGRPLSGQPVGRKQAKSGK